MKNDKNIAWLVEVFVQYQEEISNLRDSDNYKLWFKDALDTDHRQKQVRHDNSAVLDAH